VSSYAAYQKARPSLLNGDGAVAQFVVLSPRGRLLGVANWEYEAREILTSAPAGSHIYTMVKETE
jgi:hypothetical protein